jgi:hypothetical protein
MAEGAEGQPHPIHKQEAKYVTEAQYTIDSGATSRQQPIESDQSREARHARIHDLGQRIQQSVQEAERTLADTRSFGEFSPQTPSKEQKKTGISGLINRLVGRRKSTETPPQK